MFGVPLEVMNYSAVMDWVQMRLRGKYRIDTNGYIFCHFVRFYHC